MSDTTLKAVLLGEDRSMGRTFEGVADKADRGGQRVGGFGTSFLKLAGPVGLGIGVVELAGTAFTKLTDFMGDSIDEARESEKVGKTTAQIIKSTGGAAKVSADQVGALATAISNKTGVDDEAIQTGANLLLTFKNVQNGVGEGADIFDRATQSAVDLSAAGFGSIDGASKMLGKALNDPIKGLSALGRAGVTFTDQQKKQIETMVKSGDTLGAQKIILGEVESQVGGVAEASSSMSDKVSTSWDNFKESVGTKLLPVMDKLGEWFLEKGLPAIEGFAAWFSDKLWPALQEGYETIMPGVHEAMEILGGDAEDGSSAWKDLGTALTDYVIPFLSHMFRVVIPSVAKQWATLIETVKTSWAILTTFRDVVAKVMAFVLEKFADVTSTGAGMLRALSKVPGFGWAKDAAAKLDSAAGKARTLSRNIENIPKNVPVTVTIRTNTMGGRIRVGNQYFNPGLARAGGGPAIAGSTYLVGENGPELVTMGTTSHVTPTRQTSKILAGARGGDTSGGVKRELLQPVQLMVEGRMLQQVLLKVKAQGGNVELGLA